MKTAGKFLKYFIIVSLVLIVAGYVMFGIFGFNQTADLRNGYEVKVAVNDSVGDNAAIMKTETESYFAEKDVSYVGYATQKLNDGDALIYTFSSDITEKVNAAELKARVEEKIAAGLEASVAVSSAKSYIQTQSPVLIVGVALALAAIFVYLLIMQKLAGAVTAIASSIAAGILFVAVTALTRIPADPFIGASLGFALILGATLSAGLIGRFKEEVKSVANDKLGFDEIAEKVTALSAFRFIFVCSVAIVGAVVLAIVSSLYIKFLGLQLLIAVLCAVSSAYALSGYLWALLTARGKNRYKSAATESKENKN